MAKNKFLLVDLQEDKAKKLAQAIQNESCRKILDYLADHDATEAELVKKLKIPAPTVNYNMKQLMEANLVTAEEYSYSKKGREVNHYKLANKYIIIAPKSQSGIKKALQSILPIGLFAVMGAAAIKVYQYFNPAATFTQETAAAIPMAARSAPIPEAREIAEESALKVADDVAFDAIEESAVEPVRECSFNLIQNPEYFFWFLLGIGVSLLITALILYIISRRESK